MMLSNHYLVCVIDHDDLSFPFFFKSVNNNDVQNVKLTSVKIKKGKVALGRMTNADLVPLKLGFYYALLTF